MKSNKNIEKNLHNNSTLDSEEELLLTIGTIKLEENDIHKESNAFENSEYKNKKKSSIDRLISFSISTLYFFPIIIASILYLTSLESCNLSEAKCVELYSLDMLMLAIYILLAAGFFFFLQLYLDLMIKNNVYHGLFSFSVILFFTFIYDTGGDFKSHGAYNRLVLFFSFIIYLIIFTILHNLVFNSWLKRVILVVLLILCSISFYFYAIKTIDYWTKTSCDDWYLGLKDTIMDNSNNKNCQIFKPEICYFKLFYGLFDFSKISGTNCQTKRNDDFTKNYIYISENIKNAKIIGFPRTEKWKLMPDLYWEIIQKNILGNLTDMEKATEIEKENIESVINLQKNPPELVINLKRNETLVNERMKIYNQYKDKILAKNVFYLFMDSLSRVEFKRKLPKFYKWVESKYNLDGKTEKFESFQFFKYHGVGAYTEQNMIPSVMGVYNYDERTNTTTKKGGIHYLKYFLQKGFITGQTLNYCGNEIFSIDNGPQEKMEWARFDHEFFQPFCDLNFSSKDNSYSILQGTNSIQLRCFYGKHILEHSMEYAKQFFTKYYNEPKLFRMATYEAHESTGEAIKYTDDILANFFTNFEKEGLLDDTIIYIHSDHGLAMLSPYSALRLEDYYQELILPNYFMILPKTMKNFTYYKDNVRANEQSFVTPFCIYRSLIAILNDKSLIEDNNNYPPIDNRYFDIFNQKIPHDRTCLSFVNEVWKKYYMDFCRCDNNF